MITSTYGVKLMEDGDKGQVPFDAIVDNFEHYRDHTHNGSDSARVLASSLTKGTLNLASGDWTSVAGGRGYKQTVTCPGAYTLANCVMRFRIRTGSGIYKIIHPTIVPASATQFDVIVNDNSLDLEVSFI